MKKCLFLCLSLLLAPVLALCEPRAVLFTATDLHYIAPTLTDNGAWLSSAMQAARVKIDEEGCEAAAFTAIMANATSAMPEDLPVVEMELDRPFAFAITGADGLPLFVGAVNTME